MGYSTYIKHFVHFFVSLLVGFHILYTIFSDFKLLYLLHTALSFWESSL